jgi:AcrR family transcriptional regulator
LGISRPALYYYFTSKQDILSSLIDEISIAGKDAVVEICSQQTDPVTTLRNLIQTLLLFVMHHKHAYRVVVQEEAEFAPETQRLHRAAKRTVLRGFRKAVADGMEAGHFRRLDPEVAALGLIGICNWCAFWFRPDGRMTDIEVAEQLTQMAMASLLGPQDAESTKRDFATVLQSMESAIGNVNALRHKILNR